MDKGLQKISDELETHDSIIMKYTSVTGECLMTVEEIPAKYWVRIYKDGKLYKQKYYKYFKNAVCSFYRRIKKT